MKLRNKKIMAVLMASTIATGAFAVSAANLTKNVQLRYNNINVKVDGQYKVPNMEPFFIGDSVYVSLRDAGQLIGSQVNWNGTTNTVEINTSSMNSSGLEAELATKNHELALAKSQIQKMQEQIAKYEKELGIKQDEDKDKEDNDKDSIVTSKVIDETLKLLERRYDDKYDVEWEIRLTGNSDKLKVQLRYDSKQDGTAFKKISKTNLEKLAKDVMKDIQKECGEIKIEGNIYDDREKETKAEYSMTARGTFKFEYKGRENFDEADLKDFVKVLKDRYNSFPSLNFGGTFDGGSIKVRDMKIIEDNDNLDVEVYTDYADLNMAQRAWENMDAVAKKKLENYLEKIQDEVDTEFDTEVTVYVFNENKEVIASYDGDLEIN